MTRCVTCLQVVAYETLTGDGRGISAAQPSSQLGRRSRMGVPASMSGRRQQPGSWSLSPPTLPAGHPLFSGQGPRSDAIQVGGRTTSRVVSMTWGQGSTRASRAMRALVLADDPVCRCTGCPQCTPTGCTRPSTDDDHIIPRSEGGTDHRGNRRGVCHPCHEHKSRQEAARGRRRLSTKRPTEKHPGLH